MIKTAQEMNIIWCKKNISFNKKYIKKQQLWILGSFTNKIYGMKGVRWGVFRCSLFPNTNHNSNKMESPKPTNNIRNIHIMP